MPVNEQAMQQAQVIQKDFEDHYGSLEKVVGIGIGLNARQDDLALNVQVVDQAASEALPKQYCGLDVVVNVVGKISAY